MSDFLGYRAAALQIKNNLSQKFKCPENSAEQEGIYY